MKDLGGEIYKEEGRKKERENMISRDSERSLHICGILLVDSAWKLFVYSVSKKSYSNLAK